MGSRKATRGAPERGEEEDSLRAQHIAARSIMLARNRPRHISPVKTRPPARTANWGGRSARRPGLPGAHRHASAPPPPNVMRISERGLPVMMQPYSEDPHLGARQSKLRTPRSPLLSTSYRFALSSHSKSFPSFAESSDLPPTIPLLIGTEASHRFDERDNSECFERIVFRDWVTFGE